MRNRHRLVHDERGMMVIMAGLGLVVFMGAAMLALDVGMFMVARTQAQTAADAGALAGAVALYYDDWNNRAPSGPAVQNAITAATAEANAVMNTSASVQSEDVTFPQTERVRVVVHRSRGRNNPLLPVIAPIFGITEVDLAAEATAEAAPANAMTCVKPFTVPDKWIERQTPPWDPTDTFDLVDKKGNPLPNADVYVPAGSPGYTGYNAQRDRGIQITLKAGTGNNIAPSFYYAWAIPLSTGASDYRWNVGNCNTTVMRFGEELTPEPGNMVGPTRQGISDLIARDPNARWDTVHNRPVSSMTPSPRVVAIPVFDPVYYETGKQNGRTADLKAVNYVGFFIEGMQGNDVTGRITPIGGLMKGDGGGGSPAAFPRAIVLVK